LHLADIQKLVEEDEALQILTKEEEQELIAKLAEFRTLKKTGARASNRAAACDTRGAMSRINTEVSLFLL
jgi:hypothetical protein